MLLESSKPCALQLHNDRSFWQLVQQLEESHSVLSVMKTPERIKAGVRMRLEMNIPYIGAASAYAAVTPFSCTTVSQAACCCMPAAGPLRPCPGALAEALCSEQQTMACCLQSSGRKPCTSKHSPKTLPQH